MAGAAALVGIGLLTSLTVAQGSTQRSVANDRARQIEKLGQLEAAEARKEGRALRGRQRAAIGASGVDAGSVSALALLNESATESEVTALRRQFRFQTEAEDLKQQGKAAQFASFGSAAGTLLGGLGQAKGLGLLDKK